MTCLLMICFVGMAGCLTRTKVLYARGTRLPEEANGFMRLVQDQVEVNVIGQDGIGTFTPVDPGGYVLIHEGDLAQFVRNTKRLQELLKEQPVE